MASTRIKSSDIKTQCQSMEKASATQQDWVELVAGRRSWHVTLNYLVLAKTQIKDLLLTGQMFDVTIRDKDSTAGCILTGKALMTVVGQVASVGNLAQASFQLDGSGPLAEPTPST